MLGQPAWTPWLGTFSNLMSISIQSKIIHGDPTKEVRALLEYQLDLAYLDIRITCRFCVTREVERLPAIHVFRKDTGK